MSMKTYKGFDRNLLISIEVIYVILRLGLWSLYVLYTIVMAVMPVCKKECKSCLNMLTLRTNIYSEKRLKSL